MNIKTMISSAMIILLTTTSCFAVDFSTPIKGVDGKIIHQCPVKTNQSDAEYQKLCDESAPLTLRDVSVKALSAEYADEQPDPRSNKPGLSGDEKFKRMAIAINIQDSKDGKLNLSSEDTTLLKNLIGKAYPALIVYRAWPLLDPSYKPK